MTCSPFDLKDYFLQELPSPQRVQVEAHVKTCLPCREELERLQLTEVALFSLRDEEIPQRIAFVSDQIFEPSPVRRWFSGFWGSTARLGFASAAMLSVSLIYFGTAYKTVQTARPAPAPDRPAVATTAAGSPTLSPQEIQQQIDAAVTKAVAEVEARQAQNQQQLVAYVDGQNKETLRSVKWIADAAEVDRKHDQITRHAGMIQPKETGELK